ncbi:MAG: hypothetical protein AAF547_06560 [Actinomycetota bacterium]
MSDDLRPVPDHDATDLDRRLAALDPLADPGFADRFGAAGGDRRRADHADADQEDRITSIDRRGRPMAPLLAAAAALLLVAAAGAALWTAGPDRDTAVESIDGPPSPDTLIVEPAPTTSTPPASTTVVPPPASTTSVAPSPVTDAPSEPTAARDPLVQPFAWNSPWNVPIGDRARYVPAGIEPPTAGPSIEEAILILTPDAPLAPVNRTNTGWRTGPPRCEAVDLSVKQFGGDLVPIPGDFVTEGSHLGRYPGHASAILEPDGRTVRQSQPLHVCADGVAVSRVDYPSDDLVTGDGIAGAHGGSGLSSIGGTIRLADLDAGRIAHAIKLTVDAGRYLSPDGGAHRWPATRADAYATDPDQACRYGGTEPAVRMGALLALRPDFDLAGLETDFGRLLATALVDYGGYVVGDTCQDTIGVVTEWSPDGRVIDEVAARYGIDLRGGRPGTCTGEDQTCRYGRDMATIASALHVVDDNGPATPGGAGERLAPCAAPFADGTGGPPPGSFCD